jgi:hypothetical protein
MADTTMLDRRRIAARPGSDLRLKIAALVEALDEHQAAARARGVASRADDVAVDEEDGESIDTSTRQIVALTRELERQHPPVPADENRELDQIVDTVWRERTDRYQPAAWGRTS